MNTRTALLAPAYDPRTAPRCFLRQLDRRPPTAIAAGALELKPGARVPVLIEHDPGRPVGHVRELFRLPWPDGLRWHAAIVELDDDWPGDQRCSIGYAPLRETSLLDGRHIVERALVTEVSLTTQPAIPGARLLPPATRRTNPARHATPSGAAPRVLIRRGVGTVLAIR